MAEESGNVDRPALEPGLWLARHGDRLYRYALSRLRDPEGAEEVVQETFVAGLGNLRQYTGAGSEAGWLMGILKRKVIDHVRRRNREVSVDAGDEADPAEMLFDRKGGWREDPRFFGGRPDDLLQRDEFWTIFRKCLARLPQRQADAFSLRETQGLSGEEICKVLAISASNLWVLLHRARLQLSGCLKSHGEQPGGP